MSREAPKHVVISDASDIQPDPNYLSQYIACKYIGVDKTMKEFVDEISRPPNHFISRGTLLDSVCRFEKFIEERLVELRSVKEMLQVTEDI